MAVTIEEVLDKIATTLVTKGIFGQGGGTTLAANQKTIRDGIISAGRSNSEKLLLFETDVEANEESIETGTAGLTSLVGIVNGLQVRFQGASMTQNDQWEVTVTGSARKITNAQSGAIDLTRRGYSI